MTGGIEEKLVISWINFHATCSVVRAAGTPHAPGLVGFVSTAGLRVRNWAGGCYPNANFLSVGKGNSWKMLQYPQLGIFCDSAFPVGFLFVLQACGLHRAGVQEMLGAACCSRAMG